mmetsp:Transcript_45080/g.128754  ORF Transcript_45080/g.128754 Transcript_45080/m.128754 type:complete len:203 (-) Transcript_45080:392-1000(-)
MRPHHKLHLAAAELVVDPQGLAQLRAEKAIPGDQARDGQAPLQALRELQRLQGLGLSPHAQGDEGLVDQIVHLQDEGQAHGIEQNVLDRLLPSKPHRAAVCQDGNHREPHKRNGADSHKVVPADALHDITVPVRGYERLPRLRKSRDRTHKVETLQELGGERQVPSQQAQAAEDRPHRGTPDKGSEEILCCVNRSKLVSRKV